MSGSGIGGTLGTALAIGLAPETGGLSLALPAVGGAAGSALGGALTGDKNLWKDALLGGIGGGISGGINNLAGNPTGLGNIFGTGDGISSSLPSWAGGSPGLEGIVGNGVGITDSMATAVPSASSSLFGNVAKFAPYAGIGVGSMLLDKSTAPKQVGPTPQSHPSNPGQVSPLARQSQNVDPSSYFAPSTASARSYYSPYSLQPQFMANGGSVGNVRSFIPTDMQNDPDRNFDKYSKRGSIAHFANGGSSGASSSNIPPMGRRVQGAGDGRSDSIPAQLSDGEFVVSAPVVSALGRGSNNAGAKKLSKMQKAVLNKNYKGGKPPKAMGLGSYVH